MPVQEEKGSVNDYVAQSDEVGSGLTSYELTADELHEEKKVVRKLDISLLPLFTLANMVSPSDCCNFIDRTSIGLEKDLGMQGTDFNIALTVFYVGYIVADVPSNLALKRFGSIWIAFLVIAFGLIVIGEAFVESYGSLLAVRFILGLAEGGTLYYPRRQLVLRIGIFFGTSPSLAGGFGGLLASGLLSVPDFGKVQRWRKV
ncbi:hypothetical protein D9613_007072 [Agrocybe pediades]|uniref:Major facilitator superfamily (MFS) profile domain-containing protein n=1 Tax=Agrocybe pediades TaxID=84607 RepID=A0A8H4QHL4_9AGAR|nr:hypothetical protein D9613_007072 [Agrocybe pediades]